MVRELRPILKHGRQIGPCGMCGKAREPWQRRIVGGTQLITLHYCPVLKDDVNELYGGCYEFEEKTKKTKTITKPTSKKEYYKSVEAWRASKGVFE